MSLSARIVGIALVIFLLVPSVSSLFFTHVYAQEQNPLNSLMKTDASTPINIATLTQGIFMGMLSTATCVVGGVDFMTPDSRCLSFNRQTQTYSYTQSADGGLLGLASAGIALTFNKPLGTSDYVRYLSQSFGFVKQASAANGIGFDQLSPVTKLWLGFRNLSYLLFVIVFIVIGFAIMLRAKIDPRTVMTIENQIPKLIVALILITFSFAIAGFIIDVMWVGIYLVINLFASLDPGNLGKQVGAITSSVTDNPFSWVGQVSGGVGGPAAFLGIAGQAAGGVKDMTSTIVGNIFQSLPGIIKIPIDILFSLDNVFNCAISAAVHAITPLGIAGQDFGTCIDNINKGGIFNTVISGLAGAIAFLIFAVAMLFAIGRLWWQLIKSYALFVIFALFGPVVIMSGVLPGSKTNFEYWIRHLLAYSIVFPTAMGIFLLGKTLMDVYSTKSTAAVPPLLGASGIGTGALAFMGPLLGFAVILLAPQALSMVQDALNAPDPKYLAGMGQLIGGATQAYTNLGMQQVRRAFRAPNYVEGLDMGWARKAMGPRLRNFFYGRPMKPEGPGSGSGNTAVPGGR